MKKNKAFDTQLSRFIGSWHTEGIILSSKNSPEISIHGFDRYEWMMDGCFVLHVAEVKIGQERSRTSEIIGYDSQGKDYVLQHYNNKGDSGVMIGKVDGNAWTFVGDRLRFLGGFNEKGDVFSGIWEQCTDGKTWSHFMNIKLSRDLGTSRE